MIWAAIATLYALFMLWSGGLDTWCCLHPVRPGTLLFIFSRREQGLQTVFTAVEKGLFAVIVVGAAIGIYALAAGMITI
jgi:arginine:ornithine antiporter / lysine permease